MNLVCLVSRQAMPNLLPVLMYQPKNIFLLSTKEEISCAKQLQSLLVKEGFKVYLYDDISAYDDTNLKLRLDYIFNKYSDDIFLNVTGGTKPMAFAAYEYFREKGNRVFYCNTEQKQIMHLLPKRYTEELKTELTIENYLAVYGYKIENEKSSTTDYNYDNLFELIEKNNHLKEFISFTLLVRKALSEESNKTINSKSKIFSYQKTTAKFILIYNSTKPSLKFKFDTKDFLFGDWLEYYVYWKYKLIKDSEIKLGVSIISENYIRNEIDVIFLKDYKLTLVSCKSGEAKNSALYELETLRQITSGTFGKGIAVMTNKPMENIINRAKELSITLISDLATIK
ncbi:MAG: DUF1887 family protein [Ignavibacteriales bacterium]|nr:DUF1887 family protein [Ignavibacteriales bacterium]